jgi:hypothetical protein
MQSGVNLDTGIGSLVLLPECPCRAVCQRILQFFARIIATLNRSSFGCSVESSTPPIDACAYTSGDQCLHGRVPAHKLARLRWANAVQFEITVSGSHCGQFMFRFVSSRSRRAGIWPRES